jgi:hypothetical protein
MVEMMKWKNFDSEGQIPETKKRNRRLTPMEADRHRRKETIEAKIKLIHKMRGILKPKKGEKPFAEWWAECKKEEKQLEDAKFERFVRSQ